MGDLITFVKAAFESPGNAIITIFLFLAATRGLYEVVKWLKGEMNTWYTNKHDKEEKEETVEERITRLEEENGRQFDKLESIDATLQNIVATLETMAEDERENTVATCKSALSRWYEDVKDRESITSAEYETIMSLASRYLKNGGNSVFKNKIIPYLENIPIKG